MACWYYVLEWHPTTNGERVNVGVVVAGADGPCQVQLLQDWRRANAFADCDIQPFIRGFADSLHETGATKADMDRIATRYMNCLRLTPARGTLESPGEALEAIADWALVEGVAS